MIRLVLPSCRDDFSLTAISDLLAWWAGPELIHPEMPAGHGEISTALKFFVVVFAAGRGHPMVALPTSSSLAVGHASLFETSGVLLAFTNAHVSAFLFSL